MVDAVVREWLRTMLWPEAANSGYGTELRRLMAIFYADDALIASRDPELLQVAVDEMVGLFERVGLRTNTSKTKVMTCVPGKIRTRHSDDVYNNSIEGLTTATQRQARSVQCDICQKDMQARALDNHLATQHDVYRSKVINKELLVETEPKTFKATQSASGCFICPVPDCDG